MRTFYELDESEGVIELVARTEIRHDSDLPDCLSNCERARLTAELDRLTREVEDARGSEGPGYEMTARMRRTG